MSQPIISINLWLEFIKWNKAAFGAAKLFRTEFHYFQRGHINSCLTGSVVEMHLLFSYAVSIKPCDHLVFVCDFTATSTTQSPGESVVIVCFCNHRHVTFACFICSVTTCIWAAIRRCEGWWMVRHLDKMAAKWKITVQDQQLTKLLVV